MSGSATAQIEFAPIGAEWYYGSTGTLNDLHYAHYLVEKDTILQGQSCRKIIGTKVPKDGDSIALEDMYVYQYEDIVFYYNRTFSKFTPLYYFNVKEGDTLTFYVPLIAPGFTLEDSLFILTVEGIEAIEISGTSFRRIWTSGNNGWWWGFREGYIEGIGSTKLMSAHLFGSYIPETLEVSLRCYKDSKIIYQHTDYSCDYLPTGIRHGNNSSPRFSIYPNPGRGRFIIKTEFERTSEMIGVLTDLSGREMTPLTIPGGIKEQEFQLNLSPGMYLLRLASAEGFYSQKLVIQ